MEVVARKEWHSWRSSGGAGSAHTSAAGRSTVVPCGGPLGGPTARALSVLQPNPAFAFDVAYDSQEQNLLAGPMVASQFDAHTVRHAVRRAVRLLSFVAVRMFAWRKRWYMLMRDVGDAICIDPE
eukprot:736908-Prymnesium_polylepis.1